MLSVKRNKSTQSTKFAQHIHITAWYTTTNQIKAKEQISPVHIISPSRNARETLLSDIPKEHPTSHWYFFGEHTSTYFLAIHLNLKASVYAKKI